jgi:DNA-binding transcriptional LysR family regulator
MPLHSNVIRYFDAVRKAGSIRAAARVLEISSSAVSRQILNLEREIGAPLFERVPCGLKYRRQARFWPSTLRLPRDN